MHTMIQVGPISAAREFLVKDSISCSIETNAYVHS